MISTWFGELGLTKLPPMVGIDDLEVPYDPILL